MNKNNKPITNLKDLVEGEEYYIQNLQFNSINKARFLGMDFHEGLNRDIGYWQFSERGYNPISKQDLINGSTDTTVFAIWGHDLKGKTKNEIITKQYPQMLPNLKTKEGVYHVTILHHDISWRCDNKSVKELDNSAIEDIIYHIEQGQTSSELTIKHGKNSKKETKGWWEIVNWKKIALELYNSAGSAKDFYEARKLFEDNWS